MSLSPETTTGLNAAEEELAELLDQAIDACHAGREVAYSDVLLCHPHLARAVDALRLLMGEAPTLSHAGALRATIASCERLGPYRIDRELGAGGFGVVLLAHDEQLGRPVALKLLHRARLEDPEAISRFQREACATARLLHPGIVHLYDYSRSGPPYYLVTEYVEGQELRAWSRQFRPAAAQIADLLARIADAVDYAHGQGVYHRDLKPGNILIDLQGNPHVLDFGLARLYQGLETSAPTSDGRVLGTIAYMAPEQAAGHSHRADERSDVYSLGVVLYELLAGRLPFQGPPHALTAQVIEKSPPPLHQVAPGIPRDLESICLKALAKHPAERYRSAAALAADLRAFLRGEPIEARPWTWVLRVHKTLNRRHEVVLLHDWSPLLLLLGLTILAGCALVNLWQVWSATAEMWWPILVTKVVQVALMLWLVVRYRPVAERELTSGERQIRTLVPAYYGGLLAALAVNWFLGLPLLLAPFLAVLSGMAFVTLGASIWGWLYVWGGAFFLLAILMAATRTPAGMLLLGLGWFLCLTVGSLQLRWRR